MGEKEEAELTERQKNEVDYHRTHAREHAKILEQPFSWDVLTDPSRRWWNAYWQMYTYLTELDLQGKKILVVGCGFGDDALRLAKLGADVYAFDLSPDSLFIAKALADREGLRISFEENAAESLVYENEFFDVIVARDILHHVDIPNAMREIVRVAKPNAILCVNEIYSHSITNRIRHSVFVEKFLYPRMQRFIYGSGKPYITEDERKLSERDIGSIKRSLKLVEKTNYFNFLVTRIVPDRFTLVAKADRIFLIGLKPIAHYLAGRIFFTGRIAK